MHREGQDAYHIKEFGEIQHQDQTLHNAEAEMKVLVHDNVTALNQLQKDKNMETGKVRTSFTVLCFQLGNL